MIPQTGSLVELSMHQFSSLRTCKTKNTADEDITLLPKEVNISFEPEFGNPSFETPEKLNVFNFN